jgi:predicted 2-oxoglutarate/Fe(II)-dependent dioxygenase YbiX
MSLPEAEPLGELRLRADGGDARAQVDLGVRLLSGEGAAEEGAALIERAFAEGHADAGAVMATIEAMGAGRPQSWDRAFDWLRRAAVAGSNSARRQLELIDGASIDAPGLSSAPRKRIVSERPRLRVFEGFASVAECDWLIDLARGRLNAAWVWDPLTGENRPDPARTNKGLDLRLGEMNVVVQLIRARIAAACNLPLPVFEPPQIMHYSVGEEFRLHHDYLDPARPGDRDQIERLGQRIATFLIYLNDDFEGGETDFPRAGFSYCGRRGDALLFANVDAATRAPDPLTLHAGRPPTRGEKWIFSQWIRDRSPAPPPA